MKAGKLYNKGFSLLELIVAVLIIGIISGAAAIAMSSIFGVKVSSAAKIIVDSMKQTRTKAMGLANATPGTSDSIVYAKFYAKDSVEVYVDICTVDGDGNEKVLNTQKICSSALKVVFGGEVNPVGAMVEKATIGNGSTTSVKVYFRKDTGGISKIEKEDGSKIEDCATIRITNAGSGSDKTDVIMVLLTGRCYVEE